MSLCKTRCVAQSCVSVLGKALRLGERMGVCVKGGGCEEEEEERMCVNRQLFQITERGPLHPPPSPPPPLKVCEADHHSFLLLYVSDRLPAPVFLPATLCVCVCGCVCLYECVFPSWLHRACPKTSPHSPLGGISC